MEKVFGNFESVDDLNETARNLKEEGVPDEVHLLAKENGIDAATVESFLAGGRETLADELSAGDAISAEEPAEGGTVTATEKLDGELKAQKSQLAKPIYDHLRAKTEADEAFAAFVMKKSLNGCLDYIQGQAKTLLGGKSGYLAPETVYQLAEDFYRLDKPEKAATLSAPKQVTDKPAVKKPEKTAAVPAQAKPSKPAEKPETPPEKPKALAKGISEGQLDLFTFGG